MTTLKVQPGILDIAPYIPGRAEADGGKRLIKLSSNETPLGCSRAAIEAYKGLADHLHLYPDGSANALRHAIGHRNGLDPDRILCGNGSDELLMLMAHAFAGPGDDVLMTEHAFAMYVISAKAVGATPIVTKETRLTANVDALLAAAGPNTRICYIANPNNPTGSYIADDEMARLRAGLPDHTLLVIDSAYAEYITRNDCADGRALVDSHDNVVMTRTFSKIYGLSALRVGWMYAPAPIIDVLQRIRGPFNVNAAAQVAAVAALDDVAFVDRARAHNAEWLPWLEREIARLGLTVHPSAANFVLVEFPRTDSSSAATAYDQLLRRGIIPRRLDNYGLPDCLRFSIGLADENRFVVDALKEIVENR